MYLSRIKSVFNFPVGLSGDRLTHYMDKTTSLWGKIMSRAPSDSLTDSNWVT